MQVARTQCYCSKRVTCRWRLSHRCELCDTYWECWRFGIWYVATDSCASCSCIVPLTEPSKCCVYSISTKRFQVFEFKWRFNRDRHLIVYVDQILSDFMQPYEPIRSTCPRFDSTVFKQHLLCAYKSHRISQYKPNGWNWKYCSVIHSLLAKHFSEHSLICTQTIHATYTLSSTAYSYVASCRSE